MHDETAPKPNGWPTDELGNGVGIEMWIKETFFLYLGV